MVLMWNNLHPFVQNPDQQCAIKLDIQMSSLEVVYAPVIIGFGVTPSGVF